MRRRRAGWRPARRRSASGAAALRGTAWPGWPMPRAAASRDTTTPRMSGGFSGLWMRRRRPVMRVGTAPCWASIWAISPNHQIWRVLREHEISLERRRSWCISTDPAFAQKAADIVALYLQPPENAVVLSVDEKPHIQALERAQGWLKLPNGKALTGFNHEYKRHGTTTLFAALDVVTGLVKAGHYRRRRLHLPTRGARSDRRFHYRIQSGRSPLRVDQAGRLLETPAIVIR